MAKITKKLYRSSTNRVFFGVCGGLAEYFDVDPTLVRVIFIILSFFSGLGIALYIALLILMPINKPSEFENKAKDFAFEIKERSEEFFQKMQKEFKSKKRKKKK